MGLNYIEGDGIFSFYDFFCLCLLFFVVVEEVDVEFVCWWFLSGIFNVIFMFLIYVSMVGKLLDLEVLLFV